MTAPTGLQCLRCGTELPPDDVATGCERCRSQGHAANLAPTYDPSGYRLVADRGGFDPDERGVWRYHALLPVDLRYAVWLGEGETPLVQALSLGRRLDLDQLYLKNETRGPTGSYKDRMAAVLVARAREVGGKVVAIASSGNAGAALAAYASVTGLGCVVFTAAGALRAMVAQMRAYGARVLALPTGPDRWTLMRLAVERYGWYAAASYLEPPIGGSPYGVEGYKTLAFEIWEQLGRAAPDVVALPVCYGDGLSGTARGFDDLAALGFIRRTPRLVAGEVGGESGGPLSRALDEGLEEPPAVEVGPTVAHSIGGGRSTHRALHALRQTDGRAVTVADEELLRWQAELARGEGIYAEPSALASVAALARLRRDDRLRRGAVAVAVITASGLKDPDAGGIAADVPTIEPTLDDLERALRDVYATDASTLGRA